MTPRPYLLASERHDLAFGDLLHGITGAPGSCWRLAPALDGMSERVCIFVAEPTHPRTDDLSIVKVVGPPKYLREEQEPHYQIVRRCADGSFETAGAHARADELWLIDEEVDVNVECVCCGRAP